jgi:hypothetical protein
VKEYERFCNALEALGKGDLGAGMEQVIAL